jgi:adenylosuccinate synthase
MYGVSPRYMKHMSVPKPFRAKIPFLNLIREVGDEYGATTGRPRQINWLDFDLMKMAIDINGVNKLVINKMDVLGRSS